MSLRRFAILLCALILAGCVAQPYHALPGSDASLPPLTEPKDEGPLVGLAISGGGSRAATFAAAVMEELAKMPIENGDKEPRSVLEAVNYISSVSGGSLAAAYFGLRKPDRDVQALEGAELSAPYRDFFRDFNASMQRDFEGALIRGVLLDRESGVNSIANEWDGKLFHGATFSDLYERERRRDSPTLILNATSLDSGRRFAFTTLPQRDFDFNLIHEIVMRMASETLPEEDRRAMHKEIDAESAQHLPITFDEIGADPRAFRLSLAVAGSSAVPYVIGPLTLEVDRAAGRQLYRIADGGLIDNQGLESLFQLFANKLRAGGDPGAARSPKAIIIAIDASFPLVPLAADSPGTESRVQSLANNALRLTAIMEQSGKTYRSLLWSVIRGTRLSTPGAGPSFENLRLVTLRHVDANEAIARQPPAECAGADPDHPVSPEQIKNRLSQIATRYEIVDRCDVALLRAAARIVVSENAKRILDFFRK